MKKKRTLSATYSFLLPGLGQLYSGKVLSAFLFFTPFAALLYLNRFLYLLPLFSLSSSYFGYFKTKEEGTTSHLRDWVFAATGFVAFMCWFILLFYQGFFMPQLNMADPK